MGSLLKKMMETLHRARRHSTPGAFTMRAPARDRRTDLERLDCLREAIEQIGVAIDAERQGLEKRYARECGDAGFLLQSMENDECPYSWTDRLDQLSQSIVRCERRLALLSTQEGLVQGLQEALERDLAAAWFEKGPHP